MKFAIINATIYDFDNYQEDMFVIFEKEICDIGKMKDYKNKNYYEIDASNSLVLPGLVNGHSHIYSTFARGLNIPFNPTNFVEVLKQLWWKVDKELTNELSYQSAIVNGIDYLKHGVTTIIDHHASGEIIGSLNSLKKAICCELNMRGIFCFETSDRFNVDDCIEENKNFILNNNLEYVSGLFGLHASFTLSEETLMKVKKHLKAPIHIHVAESVMDQEHALSIYKERVIQRLNRHGLITKNALITHGIHLDEDEYQIIKDKNAVIALNVTSNMNNGVGLADYEKIKKHGIKAIIGNDGINTSMALEMKQLYFAMHHRLSSHTKFTFDDLLQIINNTYEYASDVLNTKLGKIKKDYMADLVVIPYVNPTPMDKTNILGHLFFGLFDDYRPKEVFVRGRHMVNNYKVNDDLEEIYKKAEKHSEILHKKIGKKG